MKRFRSLLVGVALTPEGDEVSRGSRRAALQAQWLAERTGATITFLHSSWADLYEEGDQIRQGPGPEGLAALEGLTEEYASSGTPSELVMVEDRAWLEIIRRVQRGENDMVLVGRRNAAEKLPMGSTAQKLVRKCPSPVWAVDPDSELVHKVVLSATDLTDVGDLAVELGAYVAKACGARLHVVHAWQVPMEVQLSQGSEADREAELARIETDAEDHIRKALRAKEPDVTPELHIGCDAPSKAISAGVESLGADLVVMGTLSRSGIAGLLVGNTAERMLDRLECSLLTIKPADFSSPVQPE